MDPEQHLARVQELTAALEALPDGPEKNVAEELIGAIVELYGDGLRRVVEALDEAGAPGQEIHGRLIEDGVVASLLLSHDLYPIDLETRVREALDGVRPYMESHGGDVELLGLEDGIARLRLAGSCDGCPASAATLELAIKDALAQAAPDLAGLEVVRLCGVLHSEQAIPHVLDQLVCLAHVLGCDVRVTDRAHAEQASEELTLLGGVVPERGRAEEAAVDGHLRLLAHVVVEERPAGDPDAAFS